MVTRMMALLSISLVIGMAAAGFSPPAVFSAPLSDPALWA